MAASGVTGSSTGSFGHFGRFDLMASAIAAIPVTVRTGHATVPTHTDGGTIWINDDEPLEDLGLIREAVVVHALLLRHGGLDRAGLRRLRRPSIAHRYFGFEVHRALVLGSPVPLAGLIAGATRGTGRPVSASAEESVDWARRDVPADPTPHHWGTLLPAVIRHNQAAVHVTDGAAAENSSPSGRDTEGSPSDDAPERERTDMFTLMARRIRKGTNARRRGVGPGTMVEGSSSGSQSRRGQGGPLMPLVPAASERSDTSTLYPEWDVRRGAYRADWCHVRERPITLGHGGTVAQTLPDPHLRTAMARLARSLAGVRGQFDGDDIDLDAAIDRQVSRRTNDYRERGVHVARLRVRPELSVLILMDASSSTAEPIGGGLTVFDEQRTAATALTDAMTGVGLSTAWWTFRSQGRHAVTIEQVKSFDDAVDYDMCARAAALRPSGFTRLGAAIRHASRAIDARAGAGRRLLLVLSDGVAFDHGYEGHHADGDARMAIEEARLRRIGCLSLTVGVRHDDTRLRDTFGVENYLRFTSWDTLRGDLAPLLRNAIRTSR